MSRSSIRLRGRRHDFIGDVLFFMMASAILALPADAIAQIRSSITITSLNGVVLELLKNSLDAQAHKIEVIVDYSRGSCTVEDDGLGIAPSEFRDGGGLGKLYHTSKQNGPGSTHGRSGLFLAALGALSLLSITSRHHLYHSHNSLSINMSQVIAREVPARLQQHITVSKHGTRVVVRDLFGNMPVRVKQRAAGSEGASGIGKDWEELRKLVTHLVLTWNGDVSLTIRDALASQKIQFRGAGHLNLNGGMTDEPNLVRHVCSTLSQATLIPSPNQSSWVSASASASGINIRAVISLEAAPTKSIQFISLGLFALGTQDGHNSLYEGINRLFLNSYYGCEEYLDEVDDNEKRKRSSDPGRNKTDGFRNEDLKGSKKGVDRWPMFFIKVELPDPGIIACQSVVGGITNGNSGMLDSVVDLLHAMIFEFLKNHHFRPRTIGSVKNHKDSAFKDLSSPSTGSSLSCVDDDHANFVRRCERSTTPRSRVPQVRHPSKRCVSYCTKTHAESRSLPQNPQKGMDSPFNTWSRIKTGKSRSVTASLEKLRHSENSGLRTADQSSRLSNSTPDSILDKDITPESQNLIEESNAWISGIVRKWSNPIFCPAAEGIPHACEEVSVAQVHHWRTWSHVEIDQTLGEASASFARRISKEALRQAEVISQVDRKFLLIKIPTVSSVADDGGTLVLVDQHAADERCRIEDLLGELFITATLDKTVTRRVSSQSGILTMALEKPIVILLAGREVQLLRTYIPHFADWGILYDLPSVTQSANQNQEQKVTITSLPPGITERCRTAPKLLIELLRSEAWKCYERASRSNGRNALTSTFQPEDTGIGLQGKQAWLRRIHECPQGILDALNSRSCRGAIMFNDELSMDQCRSLVSRLANCAFPFQCAHGRPSMVPLVDLGTLFLHGSSSSEGKSNDRKDFVTAFRQWKEAKVSISGG